MQAVVLFARDHYLFHLSPSYVLLAYGLIPFPRHPFFFFFALTSCCFQSFRFCTLSCVSTAAFKYPIICAFSVSEISSYSSVIHPHLPHCIFLRNSYSSIFSLLLLPSFEAPQWGTADAEIKVPSVESIDLKGSPFKAPPEGRPGMSVVSPLSGISGLSFDSTLLSHLLFFCLVLLPFLSYRFLPAGPFF